MPPGNIDRSQAKANQQQFNAINIKSEFVSIYRNAYAMLWHFSIFKLFWYTLRSRSERSWAEQRCCRQFDWEREKRKNATKLVFVIWSWNAWNCYFYLLFNKIAPAATAAAQPPSQMQHTMQLTGRNDNLTDIKKRNECLFDVVWMLLCFHSSFFDVKR